MSQLIEAKFAILQEIQTLLEKEDSLKLLQPSGPDPDLWSPLEAKLQISLGALNNIYASAVDIREGKSGPRLIGLLGHFSSGKSSLVNALLEVKPGETPGYLRKTDSHPTDTGITFITHQNDIDVVRKRKITSVQQIDIVYGPPIDFLKNRVLVDTPGLGNEAGEHELAEKILHLCHVVILTIDGSLPIAHKEDGFGLLDKAINSLKDVPKVFAITKSSSFLTHRKGDFSKDWDEKEANEWWEKTIQRILSDSRFAASHKSIREIPKYFVDSPELFNIDLLKNEVVKKTEVEDQNTRVFYAQVDYLVSTAKKSMAGIIGFLDLRLRGLNEFYEQAESKAKESQNILNQVSTPIDSAVQTVKEKIDKLKKEFDPGNNFLEIKNADEEILKSGYFEMQDLEKCLLSESSIAKQHAFSEIRIAANQFANNSLAFFKRKRFSKKSATEKIFRTSRNADLTADETKVFSHTKTYFRASVRQVIRDLKSRFKNEQYRLESTDFEDLLSAVKSSVSGGIGQYTYSYSMAAKSFAAYVMQPSSKRVLMEYGLVLFSNESGKPDEITELKPSVFDTYKEVESINSTYNQSAVSLKEKQGQELSGFKELLEIDFDDDIETSSEDIRALILSAGLGLSYESSVSLEFNKIESHIKVALAKRADVLKQFVREMKVLWQVRLGFLFRIALALCAIYLITRIDWVTNFVHSNLHEIQTKSIVGFIVATGFAILSYVITGSIKIDLLNKIKLQPGIFWRFISERRKIASTLMTEIQASLLTFETSLVTNAQVTEILRAQIQKWFQRSVVYPKLAGFYKPIYEMQNVRFQLLQKYEGEINSVMPRISKEVKRKTDLNRTEFIEDKMQRVRETKKTIVGLRDSLNGLNGKL